MSENNKVSMEHVERAHGLENEIKASRETIGALRQTIIGLERKIEDDKKRVTIVEETPGARVREPWGGSTVSMPSTHKIRTVNMDEAVKLIAEKTNSKLETELKEAKAALKSKESHIADLEQSIEHIEAKKNRAIDTIEATYYEEKHQAEKSFADSNTKLKHQVQDLKEELVKVKADKTDEQLEKTRKEEVAKLKARIKTLEREVGRIANLSWFGRTWDRIANRDARVEALKQLEDEENSKSITTGRGLLDWITFPFGY